MSISIAIADSDIQNRDKLKEIASFIKDAYVISEMESGFELLKIIKSIKLDIAFLNVEYKSEDMFQSVRMLRELSPCTRIVICSKCNDFMQCAFELHAYDYLIVPAKPERIFNIIKSCEIEKRQIIKDMTSRIFNNRFCVKNGEEKVLIGIEDIIMFEKFQRKVLIHTNDECFETYSSLSQIHDTIKNRQFIRVHQSYLVNIKEIKLIRNNLNENIMINPQ